MGPMRPGIMGALLMSWGETKRDIAENLGTADLTALLSCWLSFHKPFCFKVFWKIGVVRKYFSLVVGTGLPLPRICTCLCSCPHPFL